MQGWAKGLKDRAERAASQLSQVSTAFTPPEDEAEGQLDGSAANSGSAPSQGGGDLSGAGVQCVGQVEWVRVNLSCVLVFLLAADSAWGGGVM